MTQQITTFDTSMQEHLRRLKEQIEGLAVTDSQSYITAGQALVDTKNVIKEWERLADTEIDPLKADLDRARNKWKTFIEPGKQIVAALTLRLNGWKEQERRRAEEETRRENEERRIAAEKQAKAEREERERFAAEERKRQEVIAAAERKERERQAEEARKAGEISKREADRQKAQAAREAEEQKKAAREAEERERKRAEEDAKAAVTNVKQVEVKPAVPTVAGMKNQVYFSGTVIDEGAIIREFIQTTSAERRGFLRRFICISEKEVGAFAREMRDNEKSASLLPGCSFTSKG